MTAPSGPAGGRRQGRLDPETFDLDVERIRSGHFTDVYFQRTKLVLEHFDDHPRVLMQVFQKHEAIVAGIDEAVAVLKLCAGHFEGDRWIAGWDRLDVRALNEGDETKPWETVMTIEGDYSLFAHLETVYLGCLARRTRVAGNVRRLVRAACGKAVLFFPARHDHWRQQPGDGWAAFVGGAEAVSTDAQGEWWGSPGMGTVPHALIAAYGGDTALAASRFADMYHPETKIIVLVDFENDSVKTSLEVAEALGDRLWGVRLDTSGSIVDRCLWGEMGDFTPSGVNIRLVHKVREALDANGFENVKIVVSGGFDVAKVTAFEEAGAPVDAYGVGSSLLRGENDYTADIVLVEGQPGAKVGRRHKPNPRLERVS